MLQKKICNSLDMLFFRKLFFFSLLWLIFFSALGQNNLATKYENYKNRFQSKFLTKTINPREKGNFIPIECIYYNGNLHYADQTWYLGMYLAVLAMEQHIYEEEGKIKEADMSLQQIRNILITINRLDSVAETYYGKETSINGFFIRQDRIKKPSPMSQDQVWALLYGFRFITKYVSDIEIVEESRAISERIVKALNPIVRTKTKKRNWSVIDPNGQQIQPPIDLWFTRYAFVLSLEQILGRKVKIPKGKNLFSKLMYKLGHSQTYHKYLFRSGHNRYNTYGILNLYVLAQPNKALSYSLKIEKIVQSYYPNGVMSHFALSAALLADTKLKRDKSYYTKILQEAPDNGTEKRAKSALWNRTNILGAFWQNYNDGIYNGLDYMLLYNLYRIHYNK